MLDNKGWINMDNTLNQKLFHTYSKNENLIELEREREDYSMLPLSPQDLRILLLSCYVGFCSKSSVSMDDLILDCVRFGEEVL